MLPKKRADRLGFDPNAWRRAPITRNSDGAVQLRTLFVVGVGGSCVFNLRLACSVDRTGRLPEQMRRLHTGKGQRKIPDGISMDQVRVPRTPNPTARRTGKHSPDVATIRFRSRRTPPRLIRPSWASLRTRLRQLTFTDPIPQAGLHTLPSRTSSFVPPRQTSRSLDQSVSRNDRSHAHAACFGPADAARRKRRWNNLSPAYNVIRILKMSRHPLQLPSFLRPFLPHNLASSGSTSNISELP
ncbi:uncharacterized protein LAESUDRAFT_534923 [Laetiporus sulphureus 93-53]|uniref:Uncharacterized protein n=1 Tax=Laetiporus sulphureus 93-53 TaxID=1314785 RepID=A0A165B9L3_9APHY|nr:uncharacterized protein LAESUDRAFT_534923 [Laetiporus sulphureus 93-53]KZT00559.1 hypothetical protein LAESUDRAFT_534923 [Laetiporus sulphureus 93-53]